MKQIFLGFILLITIACSKSDSDTNDSGGTTTTPVPGTTKEFTLDIKQFHGTLSTEGSPLPSCMILEGIEFEYNGYEKEYEVKFHDITRKLYGASTFTDYPSSTAKFRPSSAKDIINGKEGRYTYTNWYNAGTAYSVTRIPDQKKLVVQYSWCAGEGVCKPEPCTTFRGKATVTVKY